MSTLQAFFLQLKLTISFHNMCRHLIICLQKFGYCAHGSTLQYQVLTLSVLCTLSSCVDTFKTCVDILIPNSTLSICVDSLTQCVDSSKPSVDSFACVDTSRTCVGTFCSRINSLDTDILCHTSTSMC